MGGKNTAMVMMRMKPGNGGRCLDLDVTSTRNHSLRILLLVMDSRKQIKPQATSMVAERMQADKELVKEVGASIRKKTQSQTTNHPAAHLETTPADGITTNVQESTSTLKNNLTISRMSMNIIIISGTIRTAVEDLGFNSSHRAVDLVSMQVGGFNSNINSSGRCVLSVRVEEVLKRQR